MHKQSLNLQISFDRWVVGTSFGGDQVASLPDDKCGNPCTCERDASALQATYTALSWNRVVSYRRCCSEVDPPHCVAKSDGIMFVIRVSGAAPRSSISCWCDLREATWHGGSVV